MTREEAIEELIAFKDKSWDGMPEEVIDVAIKALEQEPCGDAISRQIISDYVQSHIQEINTGYGDLNKHTNEILRMIVDYIESMSPVRPQAPKTGHWILHPNQNEDDIENDNYMYVCSECSHADIHSRSTVVPYCWYCGAKMFEPQETQESDHKCHTCKHYTSGEHDGSCGSYICKNYSDWESEDKE